MSDRRLIHVAAACVLAAGIACPAGDASAGAPAPPAAVGGLPPGWLPLTVMKDDVGWGTYVDMKDRAKLFVPAVPVIRGVILNYEIGAHEDVREIARAWGFANVSIPWSFEYDIGHDDRRSGRFKATGLPVGDMGVFLKYLEAAAKELARPDLAVAPIVAWVGQNGGKMAEDLEKRAPGRCIGWGDAWYHDWLKRPQLTATVPVAAWWEFKEAKQKAEAKARIGPEVAGRPTPPKDLHCFATSYGFGHGFWQRPVMYYAFLDACIRVRLPKEAPAAGQPTSLKTLDPLDGWCGDYNDVSNWAPIAPAREAKGFVDPVWLPDAYFAWIWRAYFTHDPDVKIVKPYVPWHRGDWRNGGKNDCGLGFDRPVKQGTKLTFQAEVKGPYVKVEFHDGDRIVGEGKAPDWQLDGVELPRGIRGVFAVGVTAEGTRGCSRPAFLRVE